jgi:hypothetical protein
LFSIGGIHICISLSLVGIGRRETHSSEVDRTRQILIFGDDEGVKKTTEEEERRGKYYTTPTIQAAYIPYIFILGTPDS